MQLLFLLLLPFLSSYLELNDEELFLVFNTGLFKLQDLVKSPPSPKTEIYIRQAGPGTYRQVLREIRHKEIYKLIIDTDPAYMQQFFRAVSCKLTLFLFPFFSKLRGAE